MDEVDEAHREPLEEALELYTQTVDGRECFYLPFTVWRQYGQTRWVIDAPVAEDDDGKYSPGIRTTALQKTYGIDADALLDVCREYSRDLDGVAGVAVVMLLYFDMDSVEIVDVEFPESEIFAFDRFDQEYEDFMSDLIAHSSRPFKATNETGNSGSW